MQQRAQCVHVESVRYFTLCLCSFQVEYVLISHEVCAISYGVLCYFLWSLCYFMWSLCSSHVESVLVRGALQGALQGVFQDAL